MLAIVKRRARPVKTKHDRLGTFFFSCVKVTKLKLLKQAHMPSVQVLLRSIRRALLVRDITATQAVLSGTT